MPEQKITSRLWFGPNAEEAVAHYLSIFANSRIVSAGIDTAWEELAEGGHIQCGWLTDKFGVSWQIAPELCQGFWAVTLNAPIASCGR